MENANHLVLLAGLCKKMGLTPEDAEGLITQESVDFWNEIINIRIKKKK